MARTLDKDWNQSVRSPWREEHERVSALEQRLGDLERATEQAPPSLDERRERARLTMEIRGAEAAEEQFEAIRHEYPDDPEANFHLGVGRIERGDERGLALLERAMDGDPEAILPACRLAYDFLLSADRPAEAERFRARALERDRELQLAAAERRAIEPTAGVEPHGLDAPAVRALVDQLRSYRQVRRALLGRKALATLADEAPLLVIGIRVRVPWWKPVGSSHRTDVIQRLARELTLPEHFFVIDAHSRRFRRLRRRLEELPGAEIYAGGS